MLKRLELVGFKSFADKTRFDFASGITGVVGPNGSGKSNVVDAVRWILGEQSAKSLRGGEMADVIFNGSSSRKSLGLAEVTVAFDNARRLLAVDADEVQLTRRVYRDGSGEYLVNGQAARLKDFKDIFLGSGAGTHGYTIIAQGRVDELLQASTRDRREIFDEAAGISRFKARKTETLRKLAAVKANVERSEDRLNGLDSQLRTLRIQASKAQKCKEYNDRLRELRIGQGIREYRELSGALDVEQYQLAALQTEVAGANRRTSELERAKRELEKEVERAETGLKHQEGRLADARKQIAEFDGTLKHERSATNSHEAKLLKLGRQWAELGYQIKALEADVARATVEAVAAETCLKNEQQTAHSAAETLTAAQGLMSQIARESEAGNSRLLELVREAADARSRETSSKTQVERLQNEYTRKRGQIEKSAAERRTLSKTLEDFSVADADVQTRLIATKERLGQLRGNREELTKRISRVQKILEEQRVRRGDLRGRIEILDNLEQSLEGLGTGVRFILQKIKAEQSQASKPPSTFNSILGLVADLLTVPHEVAGFVELALGETAQRFVVRSPGDRDALVSAIGDVPGRVGFVPYREPVTVESSTRSWSSHWHSTSRPSLSRFEHQLLSTQVKCVLAGLPHQLLGNVLLAGSLQEARELQAIDPEARIVTRAGELLEPDGTITTGPLKAEAGLVSRKSELRELREQYRALAEQIAITEIELSDVRRQLAEVEGVIAAVDSEIALLSDEAVNLKQKKERQQQQIEDLDEKVETLQFEIDNSEREIQNGEAAWIAAKLQAEEAEQASTVLKAKMAGLQREIRLAEEARDIAQRANTDAQVAFKSAKIEHEHAGKRLAQLDRDLRKKQTDAVALSRTEIRETREKLAESMMTMLRASAGQAYAYHEKEFRERLANELSTKLAMDRAARERMNEELDSLRAERDDKKNVTHTKEMTVRDLSSRRENIVNRIREDFGLDLAQHVQETDRQVQESELAGQEPEQGPIPAEAAIPELSAHEVQQEIEDLRRKVARLGSVNMEALEELARVEAEFNTIQAQHADLNAARKSLQDVIDAINADSRKLFTETLTAVRGYFQELFRKLFGGGQADIVLEDPSDVLESGIEITARPPGKELRSLSLLSGGEKTLTAIALLLAIFRNKPSPFCILDEVDAALDEANTARLAGVLREFLDQSQFIVVTHKKRTMAAADRLWGVTMQESGISRLLPMRFEDWPEEEGANSESAA